MNRFVIEYSDKKYPLDIEHLKYLIGDNYHDKFLIFNIIKSTFNKVQNSDYANEKMQRHQMTFNDKFLDSKLWKYFEITPFFDLESDLKIGSKSLVGKYLDAVSCDLEQNEIFSTLSILINSLNEEFFDNESTLSIKDKEFKLHLGEITKATILKEVTSFISSDDVECNSSDFDYEEVIIFQLSLVEKIARLNKDKLLFVYCNIPLITNKIQTHLLRLKHNGCFVLVDTLKSVNVNIEDVAICSKHFIDFANEELLLDKIMDFPFHISPDELIETCKKYISRENSDIPKNILIELFPWEI